MAIFNAGQSWTHFWSSWKFLEKLPNELKMNVKMYIIFDSENW